MVDTNKLDPGRADSKLAQRSRAREQHAREIDRAIAAFRVHHMNNTKWREVFALLASGAPEIRRVRFKFVDSEYVIDSNGRMPPVNDSWCDGFPGPFQYREVEWMEVPREYSVRLGNGGTPLQTRNQEIERFLESLKSLGKLPIKESSAGFRIVAYE